MMMHQGLMLQLALVAQPASAEAPPEPAEAVNETEATAEPDQEAPEAADEAAGVEEASEPSGATTDPFQKQRVPGFPPEVDLNDEATWAELKPEQKDELRAIRARNQLRASGNEDAVADEPKAESGPVDRERAPGTRRSTRRRSAEAQWWEARDQQLVGTTVGFGVTWGVTLGAALALIAAQQQGNSDCTTDLQSSGETGRCETAARRNANLAAPIYVLGAVSGISLIGTIVSGSLLGGHRNAKPFVVAAPSHLGLGVSGRF